MRILTAKRILFMLAGLLVILVVVGWFLFGSNLLVGVPVGSKVDTECAGVYREVTVGGFVGHRIMAEPGFQVEKALYVTGKEAKTSYEAGANIQDDAHICYIQVRGNIDVGSPFTNSITIYSTGVAFYDPATLQYLQIGSGHEILKVIVPTSGSSRPADLQ